MRFLSRAGIAAAILLAIPCFASADGESAVQIFIESPISGEAVANKVHQAPIRGNALAEGNQVADFDIRRPLGSSTFAWMFSSSMNVRRARGSYIEGGMSS